MNKEKAIFWLTRRIRELENASQVFHARMAGEGMPYESRLEFVRTAADAAKKVEEELGVFREVLEFVRDKEELAVVEFVREGK